MTNERIEIPLERVEFFFSAVSTALLDADPVGLESAAVGLRQASVELSAVLGSDASAASIRPGLDARIKAISSGLSVQRESLIRRSVVVDRALGVIVPVTRPGTYSRTSGPYGNGPRSSGEFRTISA
jgi:hypothetical protein